LANHDDPLELLSTNVAITILVEETEGLAETFALQALHDLGKLVV
jgi:hypothetical protein